MQRREVLKLIASSPLVFYAPRLFAADAPERWDRVLVLIELAGGNDGLNTVIPYADPNYKRLRPRLAVPRDEVLKLDERLGLNPALEPMMDAWNADDLAIALGVGYTDPNRSHFRSIAIWDTASDSDEVLSRGWLERQFAQYGPPSGFIADGLIIGGNAGPLFGSEARVVQMRDPTRFVQTANRMRTMDPVNSDNPALAHVLRTRELLTEAARRLEPYLDVRDRETDRRPGRGGRGGRLGRDLDVTARLIEANAPVAAIKLSHGGFDTHAGQAGRHRQLLTQLGEQLGAFRKRMIDSGQWDRVMVMTYSEFGRRAAENGSGGTDHGTAAPHFVMGGKVKAGLYGQQPSLTSLDNNDLRFTTDFRDLYVNALEWWDVPASERVITGRSLQMLS
ncbi:MAG: DUF1501 domain-containing protein [Gammaproteobacteria bacterium]